MATRVVHTLVRLRKNAIASIFGSVHYQLTPEWLLSPKNHSKRRKWRKSPEGAIMLAHFVTPAESRLREKSFRNAEYVHSPYLISHLLGRAGAYVCAYLI